MFVREMEFISGCSMRCIYQLTTTMIKSTLFQMERRGRPPLNLVGNVCVTDELVHSGTVRKGNLLIYICFILDMIHCVVYDAHTGMTSEVFIYGGSRFFLSEHTIWSLVKNQLLNSISTIAISFNNCLMCYSIHIKLKNRRAVCTR